MSIERALKKRCENRCELCASEEALTMMEVGDNGTEEKSAMICAVCTEHLNDVASLEVNHWRCLNDSMWSAVPAVQVLAYRLLHRLTTKGEVWAQDLLDMLYLDEDLLAWAQAGIEQVKSDDECHVDCNGVVLEAGDTVSLIKDLEVKGRGSFTAKRGTAVRNIGLSSNPEHIEGKVEGQRIVILTKFVKKQ